ncbi:hypothetical protein DE146DRAFT_697131 [Phaeosphaeria sp. MPI-PUGE-AT-0046c]|nr:hypothetical protein DE146DRAFT_697131 [Phaeosphaeria sp. MPI-PUGE-AT-0046c]
MSSPPRQPDLELGRLRDGYPALASWIARDPDHETFIFKKFQTLAARNILHLQAQLLALQHEINGLDEELRTSTDLEARQSLRRWETFMERSKIASSIENKLLGKLAELKMLLKEYYETISLQAQISSLREPEQRPLSAFRDFLRGAAYSSKPAGALPLISGRAKAFLDDSADLLTLTKATEEDYLSRFLQDHWLFRKRISADPLDRTTIHKNIHVVRTVGALGIVLAAVLLIGAIVNLYLVSEPKAKLGLVAMYTTLFATSIALCTNARRAELFAATAAYVAVLVVFVSGDLGRAKDEQCLIQLEGAIWKTVKCPG